MGSQDGAEDCETLGLYLPSQQTQDNNYIYNSVPESHINNENYNNEIVDYII